MRSVTGSNGVGCEEQPVMLLSLLLSLLLSVVRKQPYIFCPRRGAGVEVEAILALG